MPEVNLNRRQVLLGGAFALTAGTAYARTPRTPVDLLGDRKLEQAIPNEIGRWKFYSKSGLVVPPEDDYQDELYSQLLTRVYLADDQPPMMLLIATNSAQTGVIQVHRPEICYPVGGYTLTDNTRHPIAVDRGELSTVAFTATSDQRIEQLVYWTRLGRDMPATWAQQRWAVAAANLRGEIPDAVLVRLSVVSNDRAASIALIDEFVRDMLKAVAPAVRPFLIGQIA